MRTNKIKPSQAELLAQAKKKAGTYIAFNNGRVGRTNGLYSPYESMDTTGYSKGKKEFTVNSNLPGFKPTSSTIQRKDVLPKIEEFKKGASRTINETKGSPVATKAAKGVMGKMLQSATNIKSKKQ